MARISIVSPEVQAIVASTLVPLYLETGSVSAVTRALNEAAAARGHDPIHQNRIHAIMSDDEGRAINDQTVAALRAAAEVLGDAPERADRTLISLAKVADRLRTAGGGAAGDRRELAERLGLPTAVVRLALAGRNDAPVGRTPRQGNRPGPDWSYQDVAVARGLEAFRRRPIGNVGLILPTGAGKTRTAFRVILETLAAQESHTSKAIWITHRRSLRAQAHRELMALIERSPQSLPPEAARLADRVEFAMVGEAAAFLEDGEKPALVVIDEAHHAGARTYQSIVDARHPFPVLLLTATPNRPDALPIGMDEVAFTITYRELAQRGVIITPEFERFDVKDFRLGADTVDDLVDRLHDDTADRFQKTLVLVSRVEQMEMLQDRLVRRIGQDPEHPIAADDIGFIHGGGNSLSLDGEDFLARFASKPRAILISAQMLLEGFDDPQIDAVVITYKTESVIKLMQAAGRCVRYAPGKTRAWVLQADNPNLAYRFDQRWLYQEIDDRLLPNLVDAEFTDRGDLLAQAARLMQDHNVDARGQAEAMAALASATSDDPPRLLLYGLPYFGEAEDFEREASWGVFVETPTNREAFRAIFNRFSRLGAEHSDPTEFLDAVGPTVGVEHGDAALRRQLGNVLTAAYRAREELAGRGDAVQGARGHRPHRSTTWLTYVTFIHAPAVPAGLADFLADCHNRGALEEAYSSEPGLWAMATKTELPFGGCEGVLLDASGSAALCGWISAVQADLRKASPAEQFATLAATASRLPPPPLPGAHAIRADRLLSDAGRAAFTFELAKSEEGTNND